MNSQLEEWFLGAAESDQEEDINALVKELEKQTTLQTDEIKKQMEFLLENWEGKLNSARAAALLRIAALNPPDTATFRTALTEAVKKTLPPYLNRSGFLRALGLRDNKLPLADVAARCHGLMQIKNGIFVYYPENQLWGMVSNIDEFTGSIGVTAINGSNVYSIPLEKLLAGSKFFMPSPSVRKLIPLAKPLRINANEYREIAAKSVLNSISDAEIKSLAQATLTPDFIPAEQFDSWWKSQAAGVMAGMGRSPSDARSIQELHLLLQKLTGSSGLKFNDQDVTKLAALFTRVSIPANRKDIVLLLEAIAMLTEYLDKAQLGKVLSPLKGKAPFWPVSFDGLSLDNLEPWGELAVKDIPAMIQASASIFPDEYLANYAMLLPLRCLNLFCEHIDADLLTEAILDADICSCDILLWIWKNRKGSAEHLVNMINFKSVINALAIRDLPKAWGSAQRELRTHLIDKKDFQVHLIECAGDDPANVIYALQGAKIFMPGEQQSLLVKLSRVSEKLRALLESGEGRRLMGSGRPGEAAGPIMPQPTVTSVRSHRALIKELDDIIKIHIPENREAIKVARAHGDFRENAEYDAAKERRNFLSRRRAELERDINNIQPIDFKEIDLKDRLIIGTTAEVSYNDGKKDTFYIVGAWDGVPDKGWLSYKTRLGELLLGKKVGEEVAMPDGRTGKVLSIKPLPADIVKFLAGEA